MLSCLGIVAFAVGVLAQSRLENFAVTHPPVVPQGVKTCTHEIFTHLYANSYYQPVVVDYVPYTDCGAPGSWSAITLNWTTTSIGTQYDRLAAVTLGNTEIWRTSTPEPTRVGGIIWTYIKDVSVYTPLFAKPNRMIVDLNNIVDLNLGIDGEYLVTLSVTYHASTALHPPAKHADLILPLSNFSPDQANYVAVPPALDTQVTFPNNTVKAIAELFASGNSQGEEFWWANVPNELVDDLPDGTASPKGPYREVQLLVDGKLAGAALPWAVWFTGAWNPLIWRPIPATGALDLPRYYVDLTPFVPLLADGKPHTITINVVSVESDHAVNGNWWISGNIHVILDKSSKPTTGKITRYSVEPLPTGKLISSIEENGDLNFTLSVNRKLTIEADVTAGSGAKTHVLWSQVLSYTNQQSYLEGTYIQLFKQRSTGSSISLHNGLPVVSDAFAYPLEVGAWLYKDDTGYDVEFSHSYKRTLLPFPYALSSTIDAYQSANGSRWRLANGTNTGNGTNTNSYKYFDLKLNTYTRDVSVSNTGVRHYDHEGGSLSWAKEWPFSSAAVDEGNIVAHEPARLPSGVFANLFGSGFVEAAGF